MTYDNTNKGVLFKNDRKDSDRRPDYTGNINIDGVEFWLSAWIKQGQKGKFMSLSIKPKEEKSISRQAVAKVSEQRRNVRNNADLNDEIPF